MQPLRVEVARSEPRICLEALPGNANLVKGNPLAEGVIRGELPRALAVPSCAQGLARALRMEEDPPSLGAVETHAELSRGDFATAARCARLDPPRSTQALAARLATGCRSKRDATHRPISTST